MIMDWFRFVLPQPHYEVEFVAISKAEEEIHPAVQDDERVTLYYPKLPLLAIGLLP